MNSRSTDKIGEYGSHPRFGGDRERTDGLEKIFLEFYGLAEQPFGVTPDPRFLHFGPKHREALFALDYGTETNRGFLALIAKPGMGKTSLLFQYLEGLRDKARTALVFQTDGDSTDLMRYLLADLGLDGTGKDLPQMRSMLNEVLLEEMRLGRRFVLVVDEAQNLDERGLESIRLLSNFETPWAKLMQIVLAGQPQLAERLARASLAQLRQRISLFIKIEPFTPAETNNYIDHRLGVAGYKGPQLFTVGARELIAQQSGGVPRAINNICFGAMSLGWALKRKTIDQGMVSDVMADLNPGSSNGIRPGISISEDLTKPSSNLAATNSRPKQWISPVLFPIQQDLPRRRWLPRLAVGTALLLVLGWSVVRLSAIKARASETEAQTVISAPVAADSQRADEADTPVSERGAVTPSGDSASGVSQSLAPESPVPSTSASDVPDSSIRRYSTQVGAEIRKLFRSLARSGQTQRGAL